jgi:hypothetical protein
MGGDWVKFVNTHTLIISYKQSTLHIQKLPSFVLWLSWYLFLIAVRLRSYSLKCDRKSRNHIVMKKVNEWLEKTIVDPLRGHLITLCFLCRVFSSTSIHLGLRALYMPYGSKIHHFEPKFSGLQITSQLYIMTF